MQMSQPPIKIIELTEKGYNEDNNSLVFDVLYRVGNQFDRVNVFLRENNTLIVSDLNKYRNILALTGLEICSQTQKNMPSYYMFMSIDKLYSFLSGKDIDKCNLFGALTFFMNDAIGGGLLMSATECYSLVSYDSTMEVLVEFECIDENVKIKKTPGEYYFMGKTKVVVNQYSVSTINNSTFKAKGFIIPKLGKFAKWNRLESVNEDGT
jgi:hypothetical protein